MSAGLCGVRAAQKEKIVVKSIEDVAKFYAYATPSRLPVKFEVFVSRISCITLIVFYLLYFLFFVILLLIIHL